MKQRFSLYVVLLLVGILQTVNAATGDLDLTFSGVGKLIQGIEGVSRDEANATLIQPDGKILVAGTSNFGGINSFSIARYNPNGSLDASFGSGGKQIFPIGSESGCDAVSVQPDGKIVLAGYSKKGNSSYDFAVARLNADGTLDATFDGDGKLTTNISIDDFAVAVKIQPDAKIVVAGYSGNYVPDFSLARYNADGSLDTSFGGGGKVLTPVGSFGDFAYDVAVQTDGKILVAGYADGSAAANMALVRYNPNGSPDTTFGGTGKVQLTVIGSSYANSVLIQPDGKYVLTGVTRDSTNYYFAVVRLKTDGTPDNTFDGDGKATSLLSSNTNGDVSGALQPDGKIVVANSVVLNTPNVDVDLALVRFNADGSPDTTFDGDGKVFTDIANSQNYAYDVAIQSDGKIIAVGKTDTDPSSSQNFDFLLIRYNSDGSIDNSLNGDGYATLNNGRAASAANAVLIQPDGRIVTAGASQYLSSRSKFTLMRHNPDGTLDASFDGDGIVFTDVLGGASAANALAIQPDGKIIAGGYASSGSASNGDFALARYNPDGSLDASFGGSGIVTTPILSFADTINDIVIQPDGRILVGGTSNTDESGIPNSDFALARFNANGSLDTTFRGGGKFSYNLGLAERTCELLLQPDGKFIVVGTYQNNNNGSSLFAAIRFTSTGENDGSFGGTGVVTVNFGNSRLQAGAAALQSDGKILIAGNTSNGSSDSIALARLNPNGALDTTFNSVGTLTTALGNAASISTVAVQSDGKILVGGKLLIGGENFWDALLARYNPNGSIDSSYGTNGHKSFDLFDGTEDIINELVLDSSGRAVVAGSAGGNILVARFLGDSAAPVKSPFDFDGDGKTDISIFRPSGGEWWYLKSSNGNNATVQFGNSSDKTVAADFTGDGKADIAVFRPATGEWLILRSENNTFYAFPFGQSGDIPAPADYDGDGKTDPTVFRPSNAGWYSIRSSSNTVVSQIFGIAGDKPVTADYDGDGKSDIAIFRESSGQWWIQKSGGGITALEFGQNGDQTVAGDYTGDGKADVAFWRPSNGYWYILRSEDNSYFGFPFGLINDKPVPGDYDGDGKFDPAVFRPSNSAWYLQRSTGGFQSFIFGAPNDQPVPNTFVR